MNVKELLSVLSEKKHFELRIFHLDSNTRIYTGSADDVLAEELLKIEVHSWTTFPLGHPWKENEPNYVLQIASNIPRPRP
jgi:hypothetical protein